MMTVFFIGSLLIATSLVLGIVLACKISETGILVTDYGAIFVAILFFSVGLYFAKAGIF